MTKLRNSVSLVLMVGILASMVLGTTGCIFSPDDDPDPDPVLPTDYKPYTSPDNLMSNFKVIYENMDYPEFLKLPGMIFRLFRLTGAVSCGVRRLRWELNPIMIYLENILVMRYV